MPHHPPERLDAGTILLRRARPEDAAALAEAVGESLDHLRPWMPWATEEASTPFSQRERLLEAGPRWQDGSDYGYLMLTTDQPHVVGGCGLHRRVGQGGIEIGYWVHAHHVRRGYGAAAARALTDAALALDGITRVEIHCDQANLASQAIPRALGYHLDRIDADAIEAPGEIGNSMIWVLRKTMNEVEGPPPEGDGLPVAERSSTVPGLDGTLEHRRQSRHSGRSRRV